MHALLRSHCFAGNFDQAALQAWLCVIGFTCVTVCPLSSFHVFWCSGVPKFIRVECVTSYNEQRTLMMVQKIECMSVIGTLYVGDDATECLQVMVAPTPQLP